MFCTKHDWAFIHIPKTAGINFFYRAAEIHGEELLCYPRIIDRPIEEWPTQTDLFVVHHEPLWVWDSYILPEHRVFSIVRDPYDRAMSLWQHIKSRPHFDYLSKDTPEEFWLRDIPKVRGLNWQIDTPQTEFLLGKADCTVFKLETELDKAEDFVGFKFTDTKHNAGATQDYQQYYDRSPELRDRIAELFKSDFEAYNYIS